MKCVCVCVCVYVSQLFHPQLLQLMAVSLSDDLQRISLVFEPVNVGTLHSLLHTRVTKTQLKEYFTLLPDTSRVEEYMRWFFTQIFIWIALNSVSQLTRKEINLKSIYRYFFGASKMFVSVLWLFFTVKNVKVKPLQGQRTWEVNIPPCLK